MEVGIQWDRMRQASKAEAMKVLDGRGEPQMRLDFTTCFSKDLLKGLSFPIFLCSKKQGIKSYEFGKKESELPAPTVRSWLDGGRRGRNMATGVAQFFFHRHLRFWLHCTHFGSSGGEGNVCRNTRALVLHLNFIMDGKCERSFEGKVNGQIWMNCFQSNRSN